MVRLEEGENLIGRDVAVRIDEAGVSRHHARIVAKGGTFTLEDLSSKNGTYLGEERLAAPAALQNGDTIGLGQTRLVFHCKRVVETHTEG